MFSNSSDSIIDFDDNHLKSVNISFEIALKTYFSLLKKRTHIPLVSQIHEVTKKSFNVRAYSKLL